MTLGTQIFASIISNSSLRTGRSLGASVRRSLMCILHNPTTPYAVINVLGTLSAQRQRSTLKKQSMVGTPVYPRNGGECAGVFTLESVTNPRGRYTRKAVAWLQYQKSKQMRLQHRRRMKFRVSKDSGRCWGQGPHLGTTGH